MGAGSASSSSSVSDVTTPVDDDCGVNGRVDIGRSVGHDDDCDGDAGVSGGADDGCCADVDSCPKASVRKNTSNSNR